MKLRQYEILRRETADELSAAINAYINQGWSPLGGVGYSFVYRSSDDSPTALWYQAVMRDDPKV
jgi:hypothetical protein